MYAPLCAWGLVLALGIASPLAAPAPGPGDSGGGPGVSSQDPEPEPTPGQEPSPEPAPPEPGPPDPPPSPGPPTPPEAPALEPAPSRTAPSGAAGGDGEETEAALPSGRGTLGRIVVDGNVRVSDSAFFNSLKLKTKEAYDERTILEEFRRLWDLGLFDDIIVESRRREEEIYDLIFHVRDRPLVGSVAFVGMKAVTEANIQERLSQAKAEIRRGQPVDFSLLRKAEAAIEQLLAEKGYLEVRVRARLTPSGQGQREVTFDIREGAKTKIKEIDFTGNRVFSDRRLRKMLKLTRQSFWLTSWASSKTLYHPAKFDQDSENIRTAYRSLGHLDVAIQPEIVDLVPRGRAAGRRHGMGGAAGAGPAPDGGEGELEVEEVEPEAPAPPPAGETERQRKKRVKAELKARRE
ncbi:MAG: hypothetical protein HYS34_04735, partial [Acidobacteria bacterium]|nr:hypothetical protein [Acidobacteriota bacterium]